MGYYRTAFLDLSIAKIDNKEILQNEISLGRWVFDALLLIFSNGESCNLQKKIDINTEQKFTYIPNLYLERGCRALGIHGRTMIELRYNLLIDTEINQTKFFTYLIDNKLVDTIIVLFVNGDSSKIQNQHGIQYVSGSDFVDLIKNAIKEEKGDIIKSIKEGKKEETDNWEKTRKSRMTNAINDYHRYNSVLFLGAGVCASAGLPDWNSLLKRIIEEGSIITNDDFENICYELDHSNLMIARYIEKNISTKDKGDIKNIIRKILYNPNGLSESDLIKSICKIIKNQDKVRSVITYNYDTLIEEELENEGKKSFSVYKNNRDVGNSFPVYHVHGVIFPEESKDDSEEIVLSEEDYHRVYSKIYDWSNVEQLHALTRCTCFFIGLSMKDPNLRRLLEIAKKGSGQAVRHYVFLERKSFVTDEEKREKDFQVREDILADLGLNVIWYKGEDNHKELPELLKLFTSTENEPI